VCKAKLTDITTNNPPSLFAVDTSALFMAFTRFKIKKIDSTSQIIIQHSSDYRKFIDTANNSPNPSIIFISEFVIQEYISKLERKQIPVFLKMLDQTPNYVRASVSTNISSRVESLLSAHHKLDSNDAHIIAHAEEQGIKTFLVRDQWWHDVKGIEVYTHPDLIK
jgi:predicted nucleic acid-binding protein